eukprot:Em0695g2a
MDGQFGPSPKEQPAPDEGLRTGILDVVAALGDSITAALGARARTILTALVEYRGVSWSIGGDGDLSTVTTVPNIIKHYSKTLKGFSVSTGAENTADAKFNQAVSGAVSQTLPSQAETLISLIQNDGSINIALDWKVVTIWIGGNDLCAYCENRTQYSPERYVLNIQQTLDILQTKLPRTFVNLVQILDVTKLAPLSSPWCDLVHSVVCRCATTGSAEDRQVTSEASHMYQAAVQRLIDSGRYDNTDDFTVVLQPFVSGIALPNKASLLLDNGRASTKGHKEMAVGLWNNMYAPYFYTKKNSPAQKFGVNYASEEDGQSGSPNLLPVYLGVGVGTGVLALVVVVLVVGVVIRKRRQRKEGERIPLVYKKSIDIFIRNPQTPGMARGHLLVAIATLCSAIAVNGQDNWVASLQQAINEGLTRGYVSNTSDIQSVKPVPIPFSCEPYSLAPAQTVNELTPADIKVVAAIGDSLTAAMGARACTVLTDLIEYRGVSWSIGGDDDISISGTMPNIIKKYNPGVVGYAIKTGSEDSANARFDQAVSGAKATDLWESQISALLQRMQQDTSVNMQTDWKIITVFVGGNDLCDFCEDQATYSAANYAAHIKNVLDLIKANFPRTFVNLVHTLDVTEVGKLRGLWCDLVHSFVCKCGTTGSEADVAMTKQAATDYRTALEDLINTGRYEADDFTVVIQPFSMGMTPPLNTDGEPDKSYFAPDCFHFSTKGHKEMAVGLWNNMVQPLGHKAQTWIPGEALQCPSPSAPYFYTKSNSPALGADRSQGVAGNMAGSSLGAVVGVGAGVIVLLVAIGLIGFGVSKLKGKKEAVSVRMHNVQQHEKTRLL